ncbi:MAG: ABC transporter permease [Magnetococcales bacterium]|nr:ABC transporter permease [Magnetococcales bacterium]
MHKRLTLLLPFLFIFLIWSVATESGLTDPVFLPSPQATLYSLSQLFSSNFLVDHLLRSLSRVAAGFAIAVVIAVPLGVLCGQISVVERWVHPVAGFFRYLPVAAFVPLCILWFGIDDGQKIAVITFGVVFQLLLLIAADTAAVPEELIEIGLTLGLKRRRVLISIILPCAAPAIWDDLRISAGWAWSYLVLAELVAGNEGVGYFVIQSQRYLNTADVFAGILLIGLLGLFTDIIFRNLGRIMFHWQ